MESALGLSVSRSDLWCAEEAAKALGLSKAALEEILELDATSTSNGSVSSLNQMA